MKQQMKKCNCITKQISDLISDRDVSDESIYVLYQLLTDLLVEFESQALSRLRRYSKQQEKMQKEIAAAQRNPLI